MNLTPIIKESFIQYAGAVLQSRALPDVRDMLKPSARQIFYCLYTDKFTHNKPFKKTLKAIGSAMRMYIHGDSSCEGILMRSSQDFTMRYPYIEVEGSNGDPVLSGNWSASRYTSSRLSSLSEYLFKDIEKETIKEWRDNYDDTEQYPVILPTKGFYGIVNGGMGIGVGAAFSCPQFNLKEVNEALIKLLDNPEISFDEIYCAPDFATGAILLNEAEVKESLKKGEGLACKLRSVVSFDSGERCLIVTEIPYGVYTNTICGELNKILEDEANPGIERYNDLTKGTPIIKIYLKRTANPDKVLKYLYKNTSLQSHFGINLTMLENGRYPKVFGWKEALQAHINHEKEVYRRGYEFDLNKIEQRIHIIEGLLICLAQIEEVIQTIKSSSSTITASKALCENFLLDEAQAKAVLDMKLSRLAHLEVEKLKNEKEKLEKEAAAIKEILDNTELFNEQLKNGWREVAEKFGDARRTKVLNIEKEEDEPIDNKKLLINLTNQNNIIVYEVSSLYTQKRGGVGNKLKLNGGEYVIATESCETIDTISFYSNCGKYYTYCAKDLPILEKLSLESIFKIEENEFINNMSVISQDNKFIAFITKKGLIKKSRLSDYRSKANGVKAIELMPDDEIRSTLILKNEKIGILTEKGYFLICETDDISPIGRVARGRKCISLGENDFVRQAAIIPEGTNEILFVTNTGYVKKINKNLIPIQGLNTKGKKVYKTEDGELMAGFLVADNNEVIVNTTNTMVKLNLNDIPSLSLSAKGVISVKLNKNQKVIGLS